MAIQTINLGTYANDGTGDDLRTAFQKVNANILELYSTVYGANVGENPPISGVEEGELWWSTLEGRLYIYYGSAWVDASPVDGNVTYDLTAETTTGGAALRLNGTDLSADDVKIASGTNITVTRTDASTITINANSISINSLSDVDTTTIVPTTGQALVWNGTNWVPGSVASGGGTLDFGSFAAPSGFTLDMGTF